MRNTISKRFAFGALLATAFAFAACNEDTLLGRDVIPGSDFLNATFTDTLTLETTTVREDSLRTKNMARYVLGAMEDEVFGKTYAGIHTSLALLNPGVDFNDTAFVDSAVISLTYAGHYGDTTKPFNINVYRLTELLPDSSGVEIYGESAFAREETPIGQLHNFIAKPNTKYTEGATTYKPQLRIPIDNAFAQALLNEDGDGAFQNQTAFNDFVKGFFIAPDTSVTNPFADGMMYVDLRSTTAESALTIYYHTPATSGKTISFPLDGAATNANYFKHNYNGTPVQTAIDNPAIDDAVFVQAMSGVKAKINVPYLQSLGSVILNKAEIEVTQLSVFTDPETQYTAPAAMVAVANADGNNAVLTDQLFTAGMPNFGGGKTTVNENGVEYTRYIFSVVSQLQKMLNGQTTDEGFYLLTFPSNQRADRVVLGGANRGDAYRLKLNIVYTRIPTQ